MVSMTMRVLVTGAAGFIGSHIVRTILKEDNSVTVAVRRRASVEQFKNRVSLLTVVECDLREGSQVRRLVADSQPELAIHLAWYTEPGKYWRGPENLDCVGMTLDLARALTEGGCRRLVAAGTCAEYDWSHGLLSEESTPLRPRSLYGVAKNATRELLEAFCREGSMEFAWARFFYLYGPGEPRMRLVPSITLPLLQNRPAPTTSGAVIRDFLHVDDAASALWAVAQSKLMGPVNIASGHGVKVRTIVETISSILGREERIQWGTIPDAPSDPPVVVAEVRRLRDETSWAPIWQLEKGLANTISWWKQEIEREQTGPDCLGLSNDSTFQEHHL